MLNDIVRQQHQQQQKPSGGQLSRTNSNTAMASSCEVEKYSLPSPEAAQM
eukprot:m.84575 g.84575  ORF g.84575 m.84575 type:complete len:50 (+) comp8714_c0_seq38:431-580(+)